MSIDPYNKEPSKGGIIMYKATEGSVEIIRDQLTEEEFNKQVDRRTNDLIWQGKVVK